MANNLLILGAGQYGHVVRDIAEATGEYDKISFLDDNHKSAIGRLEDFEQFQMDYANAIVALGDAGLRLKYTRLLQGFNFNVPALVATQAYVAKTAILGVGTIVEPMAVVHSGAKVGDASIISAGAIVNHNAELERGCHINCGVIVGAGVKVGNSRKIGYGEVIK